MSMTCAVRSAFPASATPTRSGTRSVVFPAASARNAAIAGALRILHDAGESVVGAGEPTATVQTTRFEIVRAGVGRRSYDQIAAWDWEGDARPESVVLARFAPPRATPLNE